MDPQTTMPLKKFGILFGFSLIIGSLETDSFIIFGEGIEGEWDFRGEIRRWNSGYVLISY